MGNSAVDLAVNIVTKYKDTGMGQAETKFGKFQGGVSKAAKVSAVALAGLGAAAISAAKAAAEDQQSQALLAKAMENTGATKKQIAATEDYIASLSRATGVTDDEMRPAMATLVRATGDAEESQKALAIALDVAAATGKPVEAVSKAMAKGFAGSTGAIGKLVPGMDKAVLASGDMNKVMKELARTTGGSAAASANTAAGKFKIFQTQMGEFQESMGAVLLPIMTKLADILGKVAIWAQKNAKTFQIIVGVVAALAAVIVTLNAVLKAVTIVQAALNLVMAANPVVLVVIAIVALVAALILAYQHSETFRKIVDAAFSAVADSAMAAWKVIKKVWDKVWDAGKDVFDWIKSNWAYLLAGLLMGPFGIAVVAIIKNWDAIKGKVSDVLNYVRTAWNNVVGYVADRMTDLRANLAGAWDAIRGKVGDVFTAIRIAWDTSVGFIADRMADLRANLAGAWDAVRGKVGDVFGAIRTAWDTSVGYISDRMADLRGAIGTAWDAVQTKVGAVGSAITTAWSAAITAIKSTVVGLGDVLAAPFKAVSKAIGNAIDAIGNLIAKLGKIKVPKIPGLSKLVGAVTMAAPVAASPVTAARTARAPGVPSARLGARAATGGQVVNVTVNGAVDPEATARQIRRILEGHNRRVGLAT